MNRSTLLLILLFLSGLAAASQRPNVIVVLLDDMGYSDLGVMGSEIATPSIDYLARQGVTVTNFYVYPRCSPTRAALLTGRAPHSVGMGFLTTPAWAKPDAGSYQGYLDPASVTLAELLQGAGYKTYMSGKWHLGELEENWPLRHGFDRYFGLISGASSYYEIIVDQPLERRMAQGDQRWYPPEEDFYLTDEISKLARLYLEDHMKSQKKTPFFLYLAYSAPHWPLHAPSSQVEQYVHAYTSGPNEILKNRIKAMRHQGRMAQNQAVNIVEMTGFRHADGDQARLMATYAAQITEVDRGLGALVEMLRKHDELDNTLILVMSDNGATAVDVTSRKLHQAGVPVGEKGSYLSYGPDWAGVSNAPFRAHKGTTFEGGVRSPLVVFWPDGLVKTGSFDQESIVSVEDIFPTIATVVNQPVPNEIDGEDFSKVFSGRKSTRSAPVFVEHAGWRSVRDGAWKAVFSPDQQQWMLFNLEEDSAEQHDLAELNSERLTGMAKAWTKWSQRVGTDGFNAQEFMKYFQPRPRGK